MFCPNCAQPVKDGSKYCEYCGFPLAGIQVPAQTSVAATPVDTVEEKPVAPVQEEAPVQPEIVQPTQPQPAVTYQQPVQAQPAVTYQQPVQAQPTAAYPQPAQQQTYAYQQPVQPQQPTYQQAATPQYSYAQLDIPAQTGKESVTKKLWFKILIGLIAALVLFGIAKAVTSAVSRALINNDSSSSTTTSTTPISSDDNVFDIIDNIVNSTASTDILDSNNNPTAYALLNKDGATITSALSEVGWTFDEDYLLWNSDDMNNAYYVYGDDEYEFTKSDIDRMDANGGHDPAIMCLLLDDYDYDSIDDVVESLIRVNIQDNVDDEDARYMILETETGEYDLAILYHDDYSELYRLEIANEAAVESGAASDFFGLYGNTVEDMWYDLTGRGIAKG